MQSMTDEYIFGRKLEKFRTGGALGGTGEGAKVYICPPKIQTVPILSSSVPILSSSVPILSSSVPILSSPPEKISPPLSNLSSKISATQKSNTSTPISTDTKSLTAKDVTDVATLDEIIPNWRETILSAAAEGKGDQEIRVALCTTSDGKFSPSIWSTLKAREVVVADYFEQAKLISEAWWTDRARNMLVHEKSTVFESTPWIFMMKNKFNWRDTKPESTNSTVVMGNVMQQVRQYITNQSEERTKQGFTDSPAPRKINGNKKARAKTK